MSCGHDLQNWVKGRGDAWVVLFISVVDSPECVLINKEVLKGIELVQHRYLLTVSGSLNELVAS